MQIASLQWKLAPADLDVVLALVRGRTLAAAGSRLGVDASTVFRALQRLERGLGRRLFERTRTGYVALELALGLAAHAETMEAALDAARAELAAAPADVVGSVRITTTDTLLHGLVAPALRDLAVLHPGLAYELHTGNELASLTRRDADIAVRATRQPPAHLVGKRLGRIRVAVYAAASRGPTALDPGVAEDFAWIAPDDALPEHPSVLWRRAHHPAIEPRYRVNSLLSVAELVALGLGLGVLPMFLGDARSDLRRLTPPLDGADTDLWLLTHPEARHLRRVGTVYGHLAAAIALP